MADANQHITGLLDQIARGDPDATGRLLNAAYADLRALASQVFSGRDHGHTLQHTALVNEVCLRILKAPAPSWQDRNHFFRSAALAMRHVLTDYARARNAERRGGDRHRVSLDSLGIDAADPVSGSPAHTVDLLALHDAAERLSELDEQVGRIFQLRFLAGLSVSQTATVLEISDRTVERDSRFIRAWLQRELSA
ncbi:MAG: sigma-70 family RNA polymerase sigma factor [Phycisphaerales bacterium]|nr:sigma-70 family RNA polymerase sigma factor [Phycisphaerales bacterium]